MIVYANISDWIGVSIGAEHFYLKMEWREGKEYKSERLTHTLTASQAKEMSKKEGVFVCKYNYRKGQQFNGFWSERSAVIKAKKYFLENFKDTDILIKGSQGCADVRECIYHKDEKKKNRINQLYKKAEKLKFWDIKANWEEMEKINKEFDLIMGVKWQ